MDEQALLARIARLEEELRDLRDRQVRELEDKDEIRRVQYMYGYYIDNRMWDEMLELFADDGATVEIGERGKYVGKASIRRFYEDVLSGGRWGLVPKEFWNHIQLQMIITVAPDGQSAKARARGMVQVSTLPIENQIRWADGPYENTYVKEGGRWKIKDMWWVPAFYAIMKAEGDIWFASKPPSEVYPPDEAPQPADATLGRTWVPFHYPHPVTGEWTPPPSARKW